MAREFLTPPDLKAALLLNGSAGIAGQVFTSAGVGAIPTWATPSGGANQADYGLVTEAVSSSADYGGLT